MENKLGTFRNESIGNGICDAMERLVLGTWEWNIVRCEIEHINLEMELCSRKGVDNANALIDCHINY